MKPAERYLKARYEDKIVFTSEKGSVPKLEATEVWKRGQGIWRDHPVFGNMDVKEVIEWLRGEDSDV